MTIGSRLIPGAVEVVKSQRYFKYYPVHRRGYENEHIPGRQYRGLSNRLLTYIIAIHKVFSNKIDTAQTGTAEWISVGDGGGGGLGSKGFIFVSCNDHTLAISDSILADMSYPSVKPEPQRGDPLPVLETVVIMPGPCLRGVRNCKHPYT